VDQDKLQEEDCLLVPQVEHLALLFLVAQECQLDDRLLGVAVQVPQVRQGTWAVINPDTQRRGKEGWQGLAQEAVRHQIS
jgi:hypothetical protein